MEAPPEAFIKCIPPPPNPDEISKNIIINPKEKETFQMQLNNKPFSLTIEYDENYIHFKIEEKDSHFYYDNFYDLTTILNIVDLSNKNNFEKIMKLYRKAIENKDVSLENDENNNIILVHLKRVIEYEDNITDLELHKKKLSKDKLIEKLFNEVNLLKNDIIILNDKNDLMKKKFELIEKENSQLKQENSLLLEKISSIESKLNLLIEANNLKKENQIKEYNKKINYEFSAPPKKLKFQYDIVKTNQIFFDIFISIKNNNEYLVSGNKDTNNIDIYDIKTNNLVKSFKGHSKAIITIKYYIDIKTKNEYLISTDENKIVIIWQIDFNNLNILHTINTLYKGDFYSVLLLFNISNNNYIITSSYSDKESSKIYFLENAKFIRDISNTKNNKTYCIIPWKYNEKNYLIELCREKISINSLFDDENYVNLFSQAEDYHYCGFVYNDKYLICSSLSCFIRIWNLENKTIYKSIEIEESCCILEMIQWSKKYVICANNTNNTLDIVDLEETKVVEHIKVSHNVAYIKKLYQEKYGECLFTAGTDGIIKLWSV